MTDFQKALAFTAIPIAALGIISTAGVALDGFYVLWVAGVAIWAIVFLVAIALAIANKRELAAGMFAGFAVGFVALAATCFANLSYFEF